MRDDERRYRSHPEGLVYDPVSMVHGLPHLGLEVYPEEPRVGDYPSGHHGLGLGGVGGEQGAGLMRREGVPTG